MFIFDLHCDTLTECLDKGKSLIKNDLHFDAERASRFDKYAQVFACFLKTEEKGDFAWERFIKTREVLMNACKNNPDKIRLYKTGEEISNNICTALLSVEGGQVLGGDLEKIPLLKKLGVSLLNIVWNGDNELASGIGGSDKGLTSLGKEVISLFEKENIILDISHLNEKGVYDLFERAEKPVVASHSNMFDICSHPRNLKKWQFRELAERKGLCGLNFYHRFLSEKDEATLTDFHRHLDLMLAEGGEKTVALGSDFDGAVMPDFISDVTRLANLYQAVVQWYGEAVADNLFYYNGREFFEKNLFCK